MPAHASEVGHDGSGERRFSDRFWMGIAIRDLGDSNEAQTAGGLKEAAARGLLRTEFRERAG